MPSLCNKKSRLVRRVLLWISRYWRKPKYHPSKRKGRELFAGSFDEMELLPSFDWVLVYPRAGKRPRAHLRSSSICWGLFSSRRSGEWGSCDTCVLTAPTTCPPIRPTSGRTIEFLVSSFSSTEASIGVKIENTKGACCSVHAQVSAEVEKNKKEKKSSRSADAGAVHVRGGGIRGLAAPLNFRGLQDWAGPSLPPVSAVHLRDPLP